MPRFRAVATQVAGAARPRAETVRAAALLLTVALLLALGLAGSPSAKASPAGALQQIPDRAIMVSLPDGGPAPPRITATAAMVIDADSGKILFSHNANARLPMASTTKIMTAILALESLDLDTKVKVSAEAIATTGSKSGLVKGEVLTVEQLLRALLIVSGNDAAIDLAKTTAGSVPAFVEKMNAKAKALGLSNTHFINTCGLQHKHHFSSAKDLATLAQYALRNPVFSRIVNTYDFALPTLADGTKRKFDNQNILLDWQDWVTGVKTGSTPYAHYCVVASGTIEGVSLIAVVLGAGADSTRWKETKSLLNYGFSLYPRTVLASKGELIAELETTDVLGRRVRLVAEKPLVVRLQKEDIVKGSVKLDHDVALPVAVGQLFGVIEFTRGEQSLGSVDLIAAQPLEMPSFGTLLRYWRDGGIRGIGPVR
ncbi:MAG: hypothetical protein A2133_01415 [Actinobacteria bacterium RBG_16_64_13]|nr:MAG: hypothetical protein A2133_01415 [Actinobacteria bacterium RBG_16_64_13]